MHTKHEHHIPGTDGAEDLTPDSCGGIGVCYDCSIQAGAAMPQVVGALEERLAAVEKYLNDAHAAKGFIVYDSYVELGPRSARP